MKISGPVKPSRTIRYVAAIIAVISLLFTQLALAAYSCPGMAPGAASGAHAMAGCTGMDMEQPALCHAHDKAVQQSLDKPDVPQVSPFIATGPAVVLFAPDAIAPAVLSAPDLHLLTRTTAPPLTIRHCCFRI
jgi:hypothetical protein